MDINPGFHGDDYFREVIWFCLEKSEYFIETGAAFGNSLMAVYTYFPSVKSFSCEPSKKYKAVKKRFRHAKNVTLLNEKSPNALHQFLKICPEMTDQITTFWLDAHGPGFKWPLKNEISLITENFVKPFIFIDDFLVPGQPQFGYDVYDGQICSFETIRDCMRVDNFNLYYPAYNIRTSKHHPLRGWCLLEYGHKNLQLEKQFKISKLKIV